MGACSDPAGWVEAHGDALYRFALSRLGNPTAAEDLVQDTFIAALQARDAFTGASTERTWMIGILRHKLIDQLRRRCRELPLPADAEGDAVVDAMFHPGGHWRRPPGAGDVDAAALADDREFWEVFARCRAALPARQAALFSLRTLEDVAPEQLCQDFGVSATNLWVLLHRARTRLRACLEEHWFGGEPA